MKHNTITEILFPKFSLIAEFINHPFIGMLAVTPTIVITPVVDFTKAFVILAFLFCSDFVTGILGSYFTWKEKEDKTDTWFFGKGEGFSSDKFKKTFIKGSVYLGFPLLVNKFQEIFLMKNLKLSWLTDAELNLATFFILVFCAIEGYSIFHENLPKCGFNLFKFIKNILGLYKEIKTDINQAKEV